MNKILNHFVKLLFISSLVIIVIHSLNLNLNAEVRYVKELWKNGGGGAWWNPWSWGNGYQSVNVIKYTYIDNGKTIHKTKVECYGNGNNTCPENLVLGLSNPPDWVPYEEYIDESFDMMLNYVYSQVELGSFTGVQSFNEVINSNFIYKNVQWEGDSLGVHIIMNIFNSDL